MMSRRTQPKATAQSMDLKAVRETGQTVEVLWLFFEVKLPLTNMSSSVTDVALDSDRSSSVGIRVC